MGSSTSPVVQRVVGRRRSSMCDPTSVGEGVSDANVTARRRPSGSTTTSSSSSSTCVAAPPRTASAMPRENPPDPPRFCWYTVSNWSPQTRGDLRAPWRIEEGVGAVVDDTYPVDGLPQFLRGDQALQASDHVLGTLVGADGDVHHHIPVVTGRLGGPRRLAKYQVTPGGTQLEPQGAPRRRGRQVEAHRGGAGRIELLTMDMEDLSLRCGPQHGQMPAALGRQFQEHGLQVPEARPVPGVQPIEVRIERRDTAVEDTQPSACLDVHRTGEFTVQIQGKQGILSRRQNDFLREYDLLGGQSAHVFPISSPRAWVMVPVCRGPLTRLVGALTGALPATGPSPDASRARPPPRYRPRVPEHRPRWFGWPHRR